MILSAISEMLMLGSGVWVDCEASSGVAVGNSDVMLVRLAKLERI
jgi:hypothetical protein